MSRVATGMNLTRACILSALLATLGSCVWPKNQESPEPRVTLELVQTRPVGTELGLEGLRETHEVWPEMIDGAGASLDLAHFYASDRQGSRLGATITAIERAAQRGVVVRFLTDRDFHATYPETLDRLDAREGVEVRLLDLRPVTGGVLHAKLMLIDGREGFLGSQNFDWRALEHIQELGLRFESSALAQVFSEVFELDWAMASAEDEPEPRPEETDLPRLELPLLTEDGGLVTPVMSPEQLLVRPQLWDLPRLKGLIDGARETVRLQLLSYSAQDWDELDAPLRAAASRGVQVQLLLSHWSTRETVMPHLKELTDLKNLEVRILTVPEDPAGFEPFSRVAHAKLMAVDGERAWIGTANASKGYFYASRNVGVILEGGSLAQKVDRYFDVGWTSPHAAPVDVDREYPEPRISR